MKIQDIIFLLILIIIVSRRKSQIAVTTGVIALAASVPLFYLEIFFTAQRLTYYGAGLILVGIILILLKKRR